MRNRAPVSALSAAPAELTARQFKDLADGWILDGEIGQLTPATLAARRDFVKRLLWFLDHRGYSHCRTNELRAFLAYVGRGHEDPEHRGSGPR